MPRNREQNAENVVEETAVTRKSKQQILEDQLLDTLADLGGQRVSTDDLIFQGKQMIIPETMTVPDAVKYLNHYQEMQETVTAFSRIFRYRPWDGAYAVDEVLRKVFGTAGIGKSSFFQQVERRTINVGPNETRQVPWGSLEVPAIHGTVTLHGTRDPEYGTLFAVSVNAPKRYAPHVEGFFTIIEQTLKDTSIYKGGAIDGQDMPEFLDLDGVNPANVIYSDEAMEQLEANVWSVLRYSQQLRDLKMPLKRTALLEGPYGTGKTLAAFLTAQVAVANGWTFIYCRPGKDDIHEVMGTARLYQPSVVFFEDVDVIADPAGTDSGRSDEVTKLLDTFDGISSKGTEIMAILTTNHPERIHRGMVRPGRLDSVIHIGKLDEGGIRRMIENVVPEGHLGPVDYPEVATAMEGFLPAFVREAIDRALRYSLARNAGTPSVLETADFVASAQGLRPQLELMEGNAERKDPMPLEEAMRNAVRPTVEDVVDGSIVRDPSDGEDMYRLVVTNGKS